MDSERIRNLPLLCIELAGVPTREAMVELQVEHNYLLREIAYQLAVMNEKKERS